VPQLAFPATVAAIALARSEARHRVPEVEQRASLGKWGVPASAIALGALLLGGLHSLSHSASAKRRA
jgi:hypothetical protein